MGPQEVQNSDFGIPGGFWVSYHLSEDPGPHAVFFSCVRRAGRGGGIQGVSVVVVVVVGLGGTLECGGRP